MYNVKADSPVSFVECLQRSSTWYLIPLYGSVNFCEKFVVRGREFRHLPFLIDDNDK